MELGRFSTILFSNFLLKVILLFLTMAFGNTLVLGQQPYQPEQTSPLVEPWRWRPIDVLSAKGVRSMTDDSEGNMWFGLNRGIMKYDGYRWELYDKQPCLKAPIGILLNTRSGHLYAGSESGLLQFKEGRWTKIFPVSDSLRIAVSSIRETADGELLIGIQDGMVNISENHSTIYTVLSKVNFFKQACSLSSIVILPDEVLLQRNFGRVDDIFYDGSNRVWLFMSRNNDGKLLVFNRTDTIKGVLQKFDLKNELSGHLLPNRNQMLQTQKGEKWIVNGFYKSGILKQKNNGWELIKLSDLFGGDELHTDIMEVSDGSLWIGGLGKLFVYNKGKWNLYTPPALPIPSSRIIFHEAKDGSIWIAGVQGDVFRLSYDTDKWVKYKGLNFQFTDKAEKDWFIDSNGKVIYNEHKNWFNFDVRDGLIDAPVKLIASNNGRVWAVGSQSGVAATAYLEDGKWHKQIHNQLSWGIDPRSVFIDMDGSLWLGASVDRQDHLGQISGILQLIDPDADSLIWRHHTQRNGIVQHNVYGIGQSPDGSIWAGGTNLIKFSPPRWQVFSEIEFFNEFIDIVHSKHNLWVGSRYYGLFRFDGNKWTHYTKSNGLPSNTVISIYEEKPEKVWVITDKDVAWFDGKNWTAGLFPEDFRIPREGGEIMVSKQGDIWVNKSLREWKRRAFPFSIASKEAYDEFWTVRYRSDNMPPISNINLYTERVDQSGNTLIGWSGFDFWEDTPSSLLTYSYRLDEGEWTEFSMESNVVLTNLSNGKHTFEVRARDLDNNIEVEPSKVNFSVKPPIWKQPWFIVLVLSFLSVIAFYETRLIKRNQSLFKLNLSLSDAYLVLETRKEKIERQKEQIQIQKEELEKKTHILEDKNEEISQQRDRLKEMVEKVEELSNIKQRFFTNISHEFRTPLTLILGSIEQLLTSNERTEKSKIDQAYEIIQRNSRRILRLINQILEIRKIEMGKLHLQVFKGDVVAFSNEIVSLFYDLASKQKIDLKFHSSIPSLQAVFDPDIVEKILFNLLSNAFKSTPSNGTITVEVSLKIKEDKQSEAVNFEVKDTGKGIPKQFIDHIFDRFYQVNEPNFINKFDSSGVGLSYVKDLVTTHNGTISVESELDKGTTFKFEIPFIDININRTNSEEIKDFNHSDYISDSMKNEIESINTSLDQIKLSLQLASEKTTISLEQSDKLLALVVEDEFEFREFIRGIIKDDFDVIEAVNGVYGYDHALTYQPDIIITDVMMPEMNGIELCEKLKDNLITNHIPVIMLTARSSPEHKMEGYQTGADAYIEKPFNREYLKIRINNLLQAKEKTREKILRDLTTQPEEVTVHSQDDKMLKKIREVLEENISNSDFDVETMSQLFNLSRFHFSRKIKQLTGLNPKEIIDSFRLKRAGQILLQQKVSISEVAYMVGFDHPNSFTRAFRKYFDMTPTEYISQNLQ
jgi:signal transduction histidine kinase/DNA-binding response OmpR family regulator/ligand-binding sensor domain-containing protein